ncbi:MAG: glycosyltransferase [Candidatus Omnitrophota bacterium]
MKHNCRSGKTKILNVINHLPPYDIFSSEVEPDRKWNAEDKNWIGIWNDDFPHLLGKAILKLTDEFDYEIWQPDIRADRVYSHTFENRLTCRVFPAQCIQKLYGLKRVEEVSSAPMIDALKKEGERGPVIFHLNGSFPGINKDILETVDNIPIVFSLHGAQLEIPSTQFFTFTKNIPSKLGLLSQHIWLKRHINKIHHITYCSAKNIEHVSRIYKHELKQITMGCDFSVFKKMDTMQCRKELQLPLDTFVMITVANYNVRKQEDKLIAVLNALAKRYNFLYIVIGSGQPGYVRYLQNLAQPLLQKNMIKFEGYRKGEILVKYLSSADMFLSGSLSEGASVSIMEAFACELPVFSTKTGQTAELMEKERVGCLADVRSYQEWEYKLEEILKTKKLPKVLDRNIAKDHYDWCNIAAKFITIYQNALQ